MTWTPGHSQAGATRRRSARGVRRAAETHPLLVSSALTRPRRALRHAICLLPAAAAALCWAAPAAADDGDSVEAGFVEELSSDAASENARKAKEGLEDRLEGERRRENRRQNRADRESRGAGSIERRQEEREREEIKDAATEAYLNAEDGGKAAEDAAAAATGSEPVGDAALPGVKPDRPGPAPGIRLGPGSYPGLEPDIYGAEVAGRLDDQFVPPGFDDGTANADGELGRYAGMPGLGQGSGGRIGAGYGGIFGGLGGVEAPSGSQSGAMRGSDEWDDDETLVIVNDAGEEVNRFEAGELDTVTGPNHDWHTDPETGDIEITENDGSDSGQDTGEFGEEHALPEDGEDKDDEDVMTFDKDDTENKDDNDDDGVMKFGENEGNEGSSDDGESSDDGDSSENGDDSSNAGSSDSGDNTDQGENEQNAGSNDGGDSDSDEPKKTADEEDTLPCRTPAGGACGPGADPEEIEEEVGRAASHSRTTMPAEPDAEGELGLELPWGISRLPEKTTTPVRPGSMRHTATPLPRSFWNPGTIDPHRGH
jgi:hypothetical protein